MLTAPVCSARLQDILVAINAVQPGVLRAWHAERVPRSFHATFSAHWRRYLYLLPLCTPGCTAGAAGAAGRGAAGRMAAVSERFSGRLGRNADGLEQQLGCDAAAVDAAPDVDPARCALLSSCWALPCSVPAPWR